MTWLSNPSTKLASLVAFAAASVWGVYWVPLRYLEGQGVDGGWAVALINLPAAFLLLFVVLYQWRAHKPTLRISLLIGVFTGLGLAFYATGLVYSSVVRVTMLFYLNPIWATLIGIIWLGEKTSILRWLAIALGLSGMVVLVMNSTSVPLNVGDLFAFLSGVFWAIGAALIMRFDDVPLPGMTMFQFIFTGLGSILLVNLVGLSVVPKLDLILNVLPFGLIVSALIFLPSVIALFWAQKFLFPGRVGLLMMSEVFVAIISSSLFIPEERMGLLEWVGVALIVSACFMEVSSSAQPANEKAEPSPAQQP